MSSYSYAPPGETAADLWAERSNFDGNLVTGVGYGVLLTITVQTLSSFLRLERSRVPWGLFAYVSCMFGLATLGLAGNAAFNQMVFVDKRAYPGGPNGVTAAYYSTAVNMMAFAAYILMNWMASGLVLWRFTMFWGTSFWLSVVPALMFLGSVGSSIVFLLAIACPWNAPLVALTLRAGIAYWALSLGLNVLLALSIAARLLLLRRSLLRLTGPAPALAHAAPYVGVAAMLVESAALYAVWGVLFLICFARGTPLQNVLVGGLGQVQGIAPVLIVFRVARGSAWSGATVHAAESAVFGPFSIGSHRVRESGSDSECMSLKSRVGGYESSFVGTDVDVDAEAEAEAEAEVEVRGEYDAPEMQAGIQGSLISVPPAVWGS
ncbi:hypothetical protein B0H15DRAFT_931411 [Mycena belliarum]|uniref:Uncharacterized protein n=1 Tax=Mycena belliarum TaxID=1033014 RepID=A0AAD6XL78_9AGAR|nr:hypothetical protein B0H15DRAFT_931411 [Mycena belliae]